MTESVNYSHKDQYSLTPNYESNIMFTLQNKMSLPTPDEAIAGREQSMKIPSSHFVNGNPLTGPFAEKYVKAIFGMGCFWGAEQKFWQLDGVFSTAVGYAAGITKNPTYQEVCSGMTGHNEVVLVVFDEAVCSYKKLLSVFFENHNPTQGMQQGNDRGTQYRSGIYTFTAEQKIMAESCRSKYQLLLTKNNHPEITTEIIEADVFYYAEEYHQQYLAKNPNGYCGLGGTGIDFLDN